MPAELLYFYPESADLQFERKLQHLEQKYSVTAMDNGDELVTQFDVYDRTPARVPMTSVMG